MKAFVGATIVAGLVVLAFVLGGFFLPSTWSVSRSIVIDAPPQRIFPLVADFKDGWPKWSAFDFEDPDIKYAYEGPARGVGAKRNWVSKKLGDGSQTITAADPKTGVRFELVMTPDRFRLEGELAFAAAPGGTKVTWTDSGDVGRSIAKRWAARYIDRMVGETVEKSLARLKAEAEAEK